MKKENVALHVAMSRAFVLAALFFAQACDKEYFDDSHQSQVLCSNLADYVLMDTLYIRTSDVAGGYDYVNYLRVFPAGMIFLSNDEQEPYIDRYDDTHWNNYRSPGDYATYANAFTGIDVVSDSEYNDIPAGGSLGSKVRIVSLSPYKWLLSRSTLTYDWSDIPEDYCTVDSRGCKYNALYPWEFPVNKYLADVTENDLVLLKAEELYLLFTETPSIKEQTITVTFREGDVSHSASVSVVFK